MLYLLACNGFTTPSSTEDTIVEDIENTEIEVGSKIVLIQEMMVKLEEREAPDAALYVPRKRSDFEGGHLHPEADRIEMYLAPPVGPKKLMVGIEYQEDTWHLSADIDENNQISDTERFVMEPRTSSDGDVENYVHFTVPYPTDLVPTYALSIELTLKQKGEELHITHAVQSGRKGIANVGHGVAFFVYAQGGDFSLPETAIVVDGDGDGHPDVGNYLSTYTLEEGLVQFGEQTFTMEIDPAGTQMFLKPTDKALAGLHLYSPAPDFEAKGTDGAMHTLAQYKGEMLLLDFWATWCGPCVALHPEVEALAKQYQLTVLGISADDTLQDVQRWLKMNPTPWPSVAQGPAGPINLAYGINEWPRHALLDSESRLIAMGDFATIKAVVEKTGSQRSIEEK